MDAWLVSIIVLAPTRPWNQRRRRRMKSAFCKNAIGGESSDRKSRRGATCTEANRAARGRGRNSNAIRNSLGDTSTDVPLFTVIPLIHPRSDELYQWRLEKNLRPCTGLSHAVNVNHDHHESLLLGVPMNNPLSLSSRKAAQ